MPPLPSGPILVRAALFAASLGSAAVAAEPDPASLPAEGWSSGARPAWAAAGAVEVGSPHGLVTGVATGPDLARARDLARVDALRRVLEALGARVPSVRGVFANVDLSALAAEPDWLPLEEVASDHRDGANTLAARRFTFSAERFDALVAKHAATGDLGFGTTVVNAVPDGLVVLYDPYSAFQAGDRIVAVAGLAVADLTQLPPPSYATPVAIRLIRAGQSVELQFLPPTPIEPHGPVAPTCGPCCHGHCDDTPLRLVPP